MFLIPESYIEEGTKKSFRCEGQENNQPVLISDVIFIFSEKLIHLKETKNDTD